MLSWLENTPVSEWVATSDLGYPILLAIHSMGMAAVVGLLVLVDLRVLGFARSISLSAYQRLMPIAWIGFGLNLASGLLLFGSTATHMISNWPFLSKMASICLGGILSWTLWRRIEQSALAGSGGASDEPAVDRVTKGLAVASILVWLAAILFGRLIAYVLDAAMLAG